MFLYMVDYAARFLRPVSIVARVATSGLDVIEAHYPQAITSPRPLELSATLAVPDRIVAHAGKSGVVLAVDIGGLVAAARRANGVIEFVPQVGDFVALDEPLFRLHGGAGAIDDNVLGASIAFGVERTIDHAPIFAVRILVDIAIKALSPAINDPTTAVLAMDQLHRLLRQAGLRNLHDDKIHDEAGELRLVFRTPNWQDFVHLAFTEIRHCGTNSVQVVRRMRSLLENLVQTLPPHRHAELREQLSLLDRAVEANYNLSEDLALARVPDPQGLGGSLRVQTAADATTASGDRAVGR